MYFRKKKSIQTLNLIKIRREGTELFCAYGTTDINDEANIRFSQLISPPFSLLLSFLFNPFVLY